MKRLSVILMAALPFSGCAPFSTDRAEPAVAARVAPSALEQADAKMADADYSGAQALYAQFINENPGHAQAGRARSTQRALDRLLGSQTELELLKRGDEAPRLRRELSEKQSEVDRLKAEIAKLKADIERVRDIDLKSLPGSRK